MTPKMPDEFEAFKLAFQAARRARCRRLGARFALGANLGADSVAFRVTARRGGNDSACVTRHDLARWLAEAWHGESNGVFVASAETTRSTSGCNGAPRKYASSCRAAGTR